MRALARTAEHAGARIAYAARASNISLSLASAYHTPLAIPASDLEGRPELVFDGPARVEQGFAVKATGRYELWLGADVDRPLRVIVDGRLVSAPAAQSGDDGTMIYVGTVTLSAGRHTLRLLRGGGDLQPDDAGSTIVDGIVFEPLGDEHESVQTIDPSGWRSLCGRSLDWIEIT